ncbi:hypothetical protein PR202_gb24864 [Eleusine coracana subsp. coracana]|uniref:Uncharacterized protein n=1 Tax=Eleusine coracana subsp. coracana TaxID=191504 RepID=A0AAV5FJV5_ELECO|nr:hypothetical protein PR202_gb24864 [Eleusine coracana subsp. coracana]
MKAGQPYRSIVLLTKVLRDGKWEKPPGRGLVVPGGLKVRKWNDLNLRWFCERSGVVLFTVGEGSNSPGCYAINLATRELQKLADGTHPDAWSNVVGYEMDATSCLASIACY